MEPVVCFLFCFCIFETKGAGSIFIQTNNNLILSLARKVDTGNNILLGRSNNSKNILISIGEKSASYDYYEGRVEFFPQNMSLILKNVQLSDTGVYTAVGFGDKSETDTFVVTVEAPVSAVSLSLDSVSKSSESCNFTVSCKTELFSISRSFTCDTHSCEEPRPQPSGHAHPGSSSLHLHLSQLSIVCNHSNHVSWTQDTRYIPHECIGETGPDLVFGLSVCVLKTVVYGVGLLLMLSALIIALVLEHRSKQVNPAQ